MTELHWQGEGPVFTVEEDGRPWRLDLASPHPGLAWSDPDIGARLLELDHVASVGRRDEAAFRGGSLVSFECRRGRIEAIYAPPDWPGLNIRAAWAPVPEGDGFDLEVQVWSTSIVVVRRVEVAIRSRWSFGAAAVPPRLAYRVIPRDRQAAAMSYDGREPDEVLRSLTTMPVPDPSPDGSSPACWLVPGRPSAPHGCYLEMIPPDDCARRIHDNAVVGSDPAWPMTSHRYGLFGHDLEKGVVLRGRLRGILLTRPSSPEEPRRRYEAFRSEPPALGP